MNNNLCQGVFVVDEVHSPLWRVAQSHAFSRNIEVISASDFCSVNQMAKKISSTGADFVIFSWRGAFDAVFSSRRARFTLLNSGVNIFLLIPDLIGIHHVSESEQNRITMADGVIVTSKELQEKYHLVYGVENVQVLHDYPPFREIEAVREEESVRDPLQIVWVGNSKWGERAGFVDHKGLMTFAIPVIEEIRKSRPDITFISIDSAVEKLPYLSVLRTIRRSACLIFTSESEGTGLPLIESAILGTPVVTLSVGVAPEILKDVLVNLISPKEVPIFASKVLEVLADLERYSALILDESSRYRIAITGDFDELNLGCHQNGTWRDQGSPQSSTQYLKWKYRWLRHLPTKFSNN
jgi:glycosyltransferase involved in cell wall biosynthesis